MKKIITLSLALICALGMVGCGKKEKHEIEILIPAGSTEAFVYSEMEIRPVGDKITIWSGAGLSDTEVILKPVEVKQENSYEPIYLTHGMPVKMDVEKGGWFKVGVSVQNDSDRGPIAVSVEVEGVEVRSVETPNATIPTIMYKNNLYRTTGKQIPAEIDESAIVGYINSVVPLSQFPSNEGEANFGEVGDPYALTADGLLVLLNNEWTIFELLSQE